MANIFDYIDWRDIDLKKVEFNEIDNLILARLSYLPFDGLINKTECVTIKEVYDRYVATGEKRKFLWEYDEKLFETLANSNRFGKCKLIYYTNNVDTEEVLQFSAITILLPDKTMYISYRGTDTTIVGWKEDLNMSFSEFVPSQPDSVEYLEYVARRIRRPIRLGGHSKGGNLAVYAAAFCAHKFRRRIINVYNNEGPGFTNKIVNSDEYKTILPKVHRYIPQASIIGRFLNNDEETTVVKSTANGIMQHDLYSWQVLGDKFVEGDLTSSSEFIDKTISKWLEEVSNEQRKEFFDCLFDIMSQTKAETFPELRDGLIKNSKIMFNAYKNLNSETKEMLKKTLMSIVQSGKETIEFPKISNMTSKYKKAKPNKDKSIKKRFGKSKDKDKSKKENLDSNNNDDNSTSSSDDVKSLEELYPKDNK